MSNERDGTQGGLEERRRFVVSAAAGLAATLLAERAVAQTPKPATGALADVAGTEHWATKRAGGESVRLFVLRKRLRDAAPRARKGTILFVHGSSMAGSPVFDLQVPGKPEYSVMNWFARLGYDTWCLDCEGYGRSDKHRPVNADVATGADDIAAVTDYIAKTAGEPRVLLYGASSGALRVALFAQRQPDRVSRLALDAFVWTGEGSPTLAERKKRLPDYRASNRRPIDRKFVHSIFTRDHPGTSDLTTVEAFADAVLALDTSVPTGTYIDMTANLPLVDPEKITVPTLIMRGQYDGIASFQDLVNFFVKLPNPDKHLAVMPGIAHSSLRAKNWAVSYHLLDSFFSQPAPVYTGD
ncbi:MAG TPA: alpha/beta fold hydrolase [Burkholderiales bacterium]|nr:alpha/beta fold hydrolase [Burkholderiales bacterium]